jgi:hypothetical protein
MKFNNIDSFLNALEGRINQLEETDSITSATILSTDYSPEEYEKFDAIVDEARALSNNENELIDYICNRLIDLGYSDDEISDILDMEGI